LSWARYISTDSKDTSEVWERLIIVFAVEAPMDQESDKNWRNGSISLIETTLFSSIELWSETNSKCVNEYWIDHPWRSRVIGSLRLTTEKDKAFLDFEKKTEKYYVFDKKNVFNLMLEIF
jgi:hypothetical protein